MGQLTLPFLAEEENQRILRPIHYLGSKLRILDFIQKVIDEVDPTQSPICDLFAGTGSVSYKLSDKRQVVSVDIQEYSKVICSALLNPSKIKVDIDITFANKIQNSTQNSKLEWVFEPLIKYEDFCMSQTQLKNLEPMCELIEKGSLITFELGYSQESSYELSKAINDSYLRLKSTKLSKQETLITRHFGGLFFSYKQAVHLDTLLEFVSNLELQNKNSYLAAVLSTASGCVNSVGKHFAQPVKPRRKDGTPKPSLGNIVNRDRNLDIFSIFKDWVNTYLDIPITKYEHAVVRMDYLKALELIDDDIRIVYADPPYTRDHYSRFYHVLETMCLRDNPDISTNFVHGKKVLSRGIYRSKRHQSPFCIKTKAVEAFESLFSEVSNKNASLILSYSPYDDSKDSHPRMLTIEQIKTIANTYYRNIEIMSPGKFSHSKFNNSEKNFDMTYNAEILIVCKNN